MQKYKTDTITTNTQTSTINQTIPISTTMSANTATPSNTSKYKKKTIPLSLKRVVWDKWIGEEIGRSTCFCCNLTQISQMNFHCGHIVAEVNGGSLDPDNLKPICHSCNSSMGSTNMDEFIKKYGLGKKIK